MLNITTSQVSKRIRSQKIPQNVAKRSTTGGSQEELINLLLVMTLGYQ